MEPHARLVLGANTTMKDTGATDLRYALDLIHSVCRYAGDCALSENARQALAAEGMLEAISTRNSAALYDWLMESLSFQGISDSVAHSYMEQHGRPDYRDIAASLTDPPTCPKLQSYWHFHNCGYQKSARACNEPHHFLRCPLPRHKLRNGRLNQTAYSLFLFIRDVAGGDLVGWIDERLAHADDGIEAPDRIRRMRDAILAPLTNVLGISHKVLNMSLSMLLIGGGQERERWLEVGVSMIAIDTLVHNFLHRTGIIHRLAVPHRYGPTCYQAGGCAELLEQLSTQIDARKFNRSFPATFPRFVQHAIWRYCAQGALGICNGNRIDDRRRCELAYCRLYGDCDRKVLE